MSAGHAREFKENDGRREVANHCRTSQTTQDRAQDPKTRNFITETKLPKSQNPSRPPAQNPRIHPDRNPRTKLREGANTLPDLIPSSSVRFLIRAVKDLCALLKTPCNKDPYSLYLKKSYGESSIVLL
jgi:hypothetical protein